MRILKIAVLPTCSFNLLYSLILEDRALKGSKKSTPEELLDVRTGNPQGTLHFHSLTPFPILYGLSEKMGQKCNPFPPHSLPCFLRQPESNKIWSRVMAEPELIAISSASSLHVKSWKARLGQTASNCCSRFSWKSSIWSMKGKAVQAIVSKHWPQTPVCYTKKKIRSSLRSFWWRALQHMRAL